MPGVPRRQKRRGCVTMRGNCTAAPNPPGWCSQVPILTHTASLRKTAVSDVAGLQARQHVLLSARWIGEDSEVGFGCREPGATGTIATTLQGNRRFPLHPFPRNRSPEPKSLCGGRLVRPLRRHLTRASRSQSLAPFPRLRSQSLAPALHPRCSPSGGLTAASAFGGGVGRRTGGGWGSRKCRACIPQKARESWLIVPSGMAHLVTVSVDAVPQVSHEPTFPRRSPRGDVARSGDAV